MINCGKQVIECLKLPGLFWTDFEMIKNPRIVPIVLHNG